MEPGFVQWHPLVGGLPEGLHLLNLVFSRKRMLLDPKGNQLFELFNFWITDPSFPITDSPPGNLKKASQHGLCQSKLGAQSQHGLPKGIIPIAVGGSLHCMTLCVTLENNQLNNVR